MPLYRHPKSPYWWVRSMKHLRLLLEVILFIAVVIFIVWLFGAHHPVPCGQTGCVK
jgi:hypothetical protein